MSNEPTQPPAVRTGDMVAYWPTPQQQSHGLRAVGQDKYIAAMVTARREDGSGIVNLQLFPDRMNVSEENMEDVPHVSKHGTIKSIRFSLEPASGC